MAASGYQGGCGTYYRALGAGGGFEEFLADGFGGEVVAEDAPVVDPMFADGVATEEARLSPFV